MWTESICVSGALKLQVIANQTGLFFFLPLTHWAEVRAATYLLVCPVIEECQQGLLWVEEQDKSSMKSKLKQTSSTHCEPSPGDSKRWSSMRIWARIMIVLSVWQWLEMVSQKSTIRLPWCLVVRNGYSILETESSKDGPLAVLPLLLLLLIYYFWVSLQLVLWSTPSDSERNWPSWGDRN